MKEKGSEIKELIQEYLLDEGLLRNKLPDTESKLEFGFQFVFPPGPVSQKMVVLKPKAKDLIIISNPIQIAPQHIEALNSIDPNKKVQFFMELRKFFLAKDVFYRIDNQNNRYEITDQIFLKKDGTISKNSFFNSIRKVFTCSAFSNIILNEFCYGKAKVEDDSKSDEFTSNFSLYS
ncbi:MAG: DUF2299 family protein [Candidatus Thorarchaeota archaeon]